MEQIYLDHNATTPVDPEVADVMSRYFVEEFGNASSVHNFGRNAKVALENAREQIAEFINCEPSELYFTSGGTESDNIAVLGTTYQYKRRKNHLIVGSTEHHAVFEPAEFLHQKENWELDFLSVDGDGFCTASDLEELISDKTALVSVMHANNESGTIQVDNPLAQIANAHKVCFPTDSLH